MTFQILKITLLLMPPTQLVEETVILLSMMKTENYYGPTPLVVYTPIKPMMLSLPVMGISL